MSGMSRPAAAQPTLRLDRTNNVDAEYGRRALVERHYRLMGILLSTGEAGVPVRMVARLLHPDRRDGKGGELAAARRDCSAANAAVPIYEDEPEAYGMLLQDYVADLRRRYQIPILPDPAGLYDMTWPERIEVLRAFGCPVLLDPTAIPDDNRRI